MTTAPNTLTAIRNKVRKVTGSPSPTELTDAQIDEYINTFYFYEFPENLRLFQLHQPYIFYTQANIDSYVFPRNEILTINAPVYIAGYESFWSQSQSQFYRVYPQLNNLQQVSTGAASPGPYTFTIPSAPILRGYITPGTARINSQVLISAGNAVARDDAAGGWVNAAGTPLVGTINYVTGLCTVTFDSVIAAGTIINSQSVPYQPARSEGLLFYNDIITLRPVPDQVYKVEVQAFYSPTQLLAANEEPLLQEWWQYLAFGAAKYVFEDRLDMDGWQKIQPFYDKQERAALRRTLVQQSQNRTSTIYTEMTDYPSQSNYFNSS